MTDDSMFNASRLSKVSRIRESDVNNLSITLSPEEMCNLWDATETKAVRTISKWFYQGFRFPIKI